MWVDLSLTFSQINYGCTLHQKGSAQWQIPLAMQCLPAVLLFVGMLFCQESPRWLARTDQWERSVEVLSKVRQLPESHPYVQAEMLEMRRQLEEEMASVNGGKGFMSLMREMWTIPGNRRRAILSVVLMVCQQLTGTNAINYYGQYPFSSSFPSLLPSSFPPFPFSPSFFSSFFPLLALIGTQRRPSSWTLVSVPLTRPYLQRASTA